ncbi:MAG: RluA family pseudouridine synthase [Clostridia bacterium]|nr:RluA family pseudouridine synthase [Clostridia bacterium]
MRTINVEKKFDNKKITFLLTSTFPSLSLNTVHKYLRKKDIRINNVRISTDTVVHTGDIVQVYIVDDVLFPKFNLEIISEDDNILVINKPSGIEVTGKDSLTCKVHEIYRDAVFKPMPCHRLDRNTSGLVLFAKNEASLEFLLDKFKNHEVEKHYLALVYGIPKVSYCRMEAFLFKDAKKSLVFISDSPKPGYQKIITFFTVLNSFENNTSLLDVQIETGKTHQIRAHLAHIGLPIVGDGKYGNYDVNKMFKASSQKLHSYMLKFNFSSDGSCFDYLNGKCFLNFTEF